MKILHFITRIKFGIAFFIWVEIGLRALFLYDVFLRQDFDCIFLFLPIPYSFLLIFYPPFFLFLIGPYVLLSFIYVIIRSSLNSHDKLLTMFDYGFYPVSLYLCLNISTMSYLGLKNSWEHLFTFCSFLAGSFLWWILLTIWKNIIKRYNSF